MATLDEQIADHLAHSLASGELRRSPHWGRPLDLDDAFARTPLALRLPYKVLHDAGLAPPEVGLMREVQALTEQLRAQPGAAEAAQWRARITELRLRLALRLEHLAASGTL